MKLQFTQVFLTGKSVDYMKKQRDMTPEDEPFRSKCI